MSLKRINHGNENHTPGFVEDTGDTMTGIFNFGQFIIEADNLNAYAHATAGKMLLIGSNATFQLVFGGATGSTTQINIDNNKVFFPIQATTALAPAYVEGGMYYDTTLHKMRIGGAAGWETITSS